MYHWIGRVHVHPPYSFSWTWNPQGFVTSEDNGARELAHALVGGDIRHAMISAIRPGGFIPFHVDADETRKHLERVHIVLQTNPRCWNFHHGLWQSLELGGLYTMDPWQEHASINLGDTDRYHLVVDRVKRDTVCGKSLSSPVMLSCVS